MRSKSDRKIEKNIESRTDGFSFRVRMKIGSAYINETFFSLEEARAYRDLLRAGKSTDKHQETVLRAKAERKKAGTLTVGSLLDRYLAEVTIHKKGGKEETYSIRRLQRNRQFSSLPVYLVDGEAIERLKTEFKSESPPLSDTTVRKYLMLISHLFKVAVIKRWCKDLQNPIKTVELPKPSRSRSRRFELNEFEYLSAELKKARNIEVFPFFEFLVETACRRGEALRLLASDVDLVSQTALLRDTKNGEDRVIGLSTRAVAIVEALSARNQAQKIAPLRRPSTTQPLFSLTADAIRCAFEEAKKRAKKAYQADCVAAGKECQSDFLEDLRLHDCRREGTSRMFERGTLDIMEVSAQTGHKTLSMLRAYTSLRASALARKLG
jgi:integrase